MWADCESCHKLKNPTDMAAHCGGDAAPVRRPVPSVVVRGGLMLTSVGSGTASVSVTGVGVSRTTCE